MGNPLAELMASGQLKLDSPAGEGAAPEPASEPVEQPTPAAQPSPGPNPLAALWELEAARDEQLQAIIKTAGSDPDKRMRAVRVAEQTGLAPAYVEEHLPQFQDALEASGDDLKTLKEKYPHTVAMMLRRPELAGVLVGDKELEALHGKLQPGQVAMREEQRGWLARGVEAATDWWQASPGVRNVVGGLKTLGKITTAGPAGVASAIKDIREAPELSSLSWDVATPKLRPLKQVPMQDAETLGAEGATGEAAKTLEQWTEARAGLAHSRIGSRIMLAKYAGIGDETSLERERVEAEQKMGPAKFYGGSWGRGLAGDVAQGAASQVESLAAQAGGAVLGLGAGAVAGLATKSPAAAQVVRQQTTKWAGRIAGFANSLDMETGGDYLQFRKIRDERGEPIDDKAAAGAALVSGVLKAFVETGATEISLKALGPMGKRLAGLGPEEIRSAMMRDGSFRKMMSVAVDEWAKSVRGETGEEGLQAVIEKAAGYLLERHAGVAKPVDVGAVGGDIAEAMTKGAAGAAGLAPLTMGLNIWGQVRERSRMMTAEQQVRAIQESAASRLAQASPAAHAELIEELTGDQGAPVKNLYIDPQGVLRLFQADAAADIEKQARDLMGEDGPARLKAALDGGTKLEVPLAEYVAQWAPKALGTALVQAGEVTTRSSLKTPREAAAEQKEIEAAAEVIAERYSAEKLKDMSKLPEPTSEAERAFREYLQEQVVAAHSSATPEEAMAEVALLARGPAVFMSRGIKEEDAYQAFNVHIGRSDKAGKALESLQPVATQELLARGSTDESFLVDDVTGVKSELAWKRTEAPEGKPLVATVEAEGTKWVNDFGGGHEAGNAHFRMVARALHDAGADVYKVGGGFRFHTNEADFAEVMAKARDLLPEKRFELRGAVGTTVEEAGQKLEAEAEARRPVEGGDLTPSGERPTLARRGERPLGFPEGFDPTTLQLPGEEQKVTGAPLHEHLTKKLTGLTPAERFNEEHTEQTTGLLNGNGFRRTPVKKFQAMWDVDGLKAANVRLDKQAGNALLEAVGTIMRELGGSDVYAAHLSGDEYGTKHDDQAALQAHIDAVVKEAQSHYIVLELANGKWGLIDGIGISFGVGTDRRAAELALVAHKQARATAGQRGDDINAKRFQQFDTEAQAWAALDASRGDGTVGSGRAQAELLRRQEGRGTRVVAARYDRWQGFPGVERVAQQDRQLSPAAQEIATKVATALREENGPLPSAEVALPPAAHVVFQIERNPDGSVKRDEQGRVDPFQQWEKNVRSFMAERGDAQQKIDEHVAAVRGQMKIFFAIGAHVEMVSKLPVGAGRAGKWGAIRKNVDPIYRVSFDASSMCVKRLEAQATQAAVEEAIRKPLTSSEHLALVALFKAAGKVAPCIYCYVESPRNKAADFVRVAMKAITSGKIPDHWKETATAEAKAAIKQYKKLGMKPDDLNFRLALDPRVQVSPEGIEERAKAPDVYTFLEHQANYAKANKPKLYEEYNGQVFDLDEDLITELNRYAGFRIFSTSDFQAEHVIDLVQLFHDLHVRGAKAHAYTKVVDFVKIFGATGVKIQTSLFAEVPVAHKQMEDGSWEVRSRDGKSWKFEKESQALDFVSGYMPPGGFKADTFQGMDWKTAAKLRNEHPDVGACFVATSDAQVRWALDQPNIDYIIPFHYSGLEGAYYKGWRDYSSTQSEKRVKGEVRKNAEGKYEVVFYAKVIATFDHKNAAVAKRREYADEVWAKALETRGPVVAEVKQDESGDLWYVEVNGEQTKNKRDDELWYNSKEKAEKAAAAAVKIHVQKIRMHELLADAKGVQDKDGTSDKVMRERYLELAEARGIEPVFAKFAEHPNYAKLKKDFARSDTPFTPVDWTKIDMDEIRRVLKTVWAGTAPKEKVDEKIKQQMLDLIEQGRADLGRDLIEADTRRRVEQRDRLRERQDAVPEYRLAGPDDKWVRVFHGTTEEYAEQIGQSQVLRPDSHSGAVFFDTRAQAVRQFGPAVFEARVPKSLLFKDLDTPNLSNEPVDEEWLTHGGPVYVLGSVPLAGYKHVRQAEPGRLEQRDAPGPRWYSQALRDGMPLFEKDGSGRDGGDRIRGYTEIVTVAARKVHNVFLTPDANLSTFLHESAHIYFEALRDMSQAPGTPQSFKDDYAKTLAWLKAKPGDRLTTDQLEQFARGFEAYVMEGRAPSRELAPVFRRFARWLKAIYRNLKGLERAAGQPIELNDEVRGVFDRLLATDAEIEEAKKRAGLKSPMFADPSQAGMSPAEWQDYLDDQERMTGHAERAARLKELRGRLNEKRKELRAGEKALRAQLEREYDALPARRAQVLLKDRVLLDEDGEDALPAQRVQALLQDKAAGLDFDRGALDEFAKMLGFWNGAAMEAEAQRLPDKATWVRSRIKERAEKELSGIEADHEVLKAEVEKGLHGDATAAWLFAELKALREKLPNWRSMRGAPAQQESSVESISRAAYKIVQGERLGKINVGGTLNDERAAAERAFKAAAKGDFEAAFVAKQQQLLHHFLWKHRTEARDMRGAFLATAKYLLKPDSRAKLGKGHLAYRDAVDTILEAAGFVEPRPQETPRLGFDAAVKQLEDDGLSVNFEVSVLEDLLARPRLWKTLTVEQGEQVAGALQQLRKAASGRLKTIVGGDMLDREFVIERLVEEARANLPAREAPESSVQATGLVRSGLSAWHKLDGETLRPATMLEMLGGKGIDTWWQKAIGQVLQKAKRAEYDILKQAVEPIVDAYEKMPKDVRSHLNDDIKGKELFPNHRSDLKPPSKRFELLMMALNFGNESNEQRLTEGRNITHDEVRSALRLLTNAEWDWVETVWRASQSLWPMSRALEEKMAGFAPKKIEDRPFALEVEGKTRVFRGGYHPAVYDRRAQTIVGERQALDSVAAFMDTSWARPGTPHSHLKKRAENFADVIALDPSTVMAHLSQVSHDLAFRESIRSVATLIMDPRVQGVLKERLGPEWSGTFLQWVKDIGQARGADVASHSVASAFTKFARKLRSNMATATLGYAADIALGDLANLPVVLAATGLKTRHWAAGIAHYMAHPVDARKEALVKSGELRFRQEGLVKELREQMGRMASQNPLDHGALAWWQEHAFTFMEASDAATATPLWIGAYRQGLAEGKTEEAAVAWADDLIATNFPSHSAVDQSAIMRDKGFVGTSLLFFGYWNVLGQRYRLALHNAWKSWRIEGAGAATATTAKAFAQVLAISLAATVFGDLLTGRGPEEGDGDDELERWANWFTRKLLLGPLQAVPVVGPWAEAAIPALAGGQRKQISVRAAPTMAVLDQVGQTVLRLTQEDGDKSKLVSQGLKSIALLTGLAAVRVIRAGEYLANETEEESVFRFLSGLVYGERKNQGLNPLTIAAQVVE